MLLCAADEAGRGQQRASRVVEHCGGRGSGRGSGGKRRRQLWCQAVMAHGRRWRRGRRRGTCALGSGRGRGYSRSRVCLGLGMIPVDDLLDDLLHHIIHAINAGNAPTHETHTDPMSTTLRHFYELAKPATHMYNIHLDTTAMTLLREDLQYDGYVVKEPPRIIYSQEHTYFPVP